jgi:tetratricopeptide (TPR) repeat protein
VGNPGPLWVYTPGQVRSVYRLSEGPHDLRVIESNGATNPGDSGGPVVNSLGQVVGVTMGYHTEARLVSYSVDVIEVQRLLASVHGILQPQTAGDYVRRGKWAFARRNLAEAQSAFRRALELDAAAAEALVGQALVHVAQAEFDLAVEASDRALQLDRKSADAYLARGLAQLHEGNAERAAADLTEALRLGGESPLVLELRGDAWAASDELARAASDYWRARKLVPRESDLRRLDQKLEQLFNHVDARQANAAM